jgi:glycosyltransferase involved in cell wall biosynthesis
MTPPLVSVIVPTHNRPQMLLEAVASALAQTVTDTEVLVADDASDGELGQELQRRFHDGRVRYHRHQQRVGMLANNVWALSHARGRYVATLHDDDLLGPTFLERLLPPLEAHQDVVVSFCDQWVMDATGQVNPGATDTFSRHWGRWELREGMHWPFLDLAVIRCAIPVSAGSVFRRTAVPPSALPEEVGTFYDGWLTYLLARTGGVAWYVPSRLGSYRIHAASETGQLSRVDPQAKLRSARQAAFIFGRYLQDPALAPHHAAFRRKYRRACVSLAMAETLAGEPARARAVLRAEGLGLLHPALAVAYGATHAPVPVLKAAWDGLARLRGT